MANVAERGPMGVALIHQTELVGSVQVDGWNPVRAKRYGKMLEEIADEGEARYIPGYKCRGGWAIDGLSERGMKRLQHWFAVPITVWDYAPKDHERYPIPAHLATNPRYVLHEGYYSKQVEAVGQ